MDRSTFSTLSGGDAAVALRSLARRFRESFRPGELAGDLVAADVAKAPPGGGPSPLALVESTARGFTALRGATEQVLVHDDPELPTDLLDRPARDQPAEGGRGVGAGSASELAGALDRLRSAAESLADRAQHVSLKDWGRTGRVGSGTVSAIELVQEAVATGRTYLDQLGPALDGVRRSPE
jgi:hypothetical protein